MKYRLLLTVLLLSVALTAQTAAQTEGSKTASKGVLNGVAISLPIPAYPPTALAVGAGGAVNVEVTIDEQGNVISATAISGHPLLRAPSVEAAKNAKFKPVLLYGQAIKVTGIIIYNFAGSSSGQERITWKQIGYEMGTAENSSTMLLKFPASSVSASVPAEWNAEKTELAKLQVRLHSSGYENRDMTIASGSADIAPTKIEIATIDPRQVLSGLKTSFESRLSGDPVQFWNFRMGTALGKASAQIDNDNALRLFISEVQQLASSAPAGTQLPIELVNELSGKTSFSTADRVKVRNLIDRLRAD